MTNHPNRKLTPQRKKFLQLAIEDEGKVFRGYISSTGKSYWAAGSIGQMELRATSGEALQHQKLIERVLEDDSANTKRWKRGHTSGYLYRVTDAGRAAVS